VADHFLRQWREYGLGPWAAIDRRTGRWLGEIGLNERPDWPGPHKVEVGWELHPSMWGQGLAAEGGRAALRYGLEVIGLQRIVSVARADNAASRRVMEKCGLVFQEELTFKGAQVVWYAIDAADWQASQTAANSSHPTVVANRSPPVLAAKLCSSASSFQAALGCCRWVAVRRPSAWPTSCQPPSWTAR
jgi:ribosomal-protein-alanine N-acetyltransferase